MKHLAHDSKQIWKAVVTRMSRFVQPIPWVLWDTLRQASPTQSKSGTHMNTKFIGLIFLATTLFVSNARAQEFDWKLLEGKWAESTAQTFGCRPENLHQFLQVSADRKTLTFNNDRKWKVGSGQELERYSAAILRTSPNMIIIKYGPDLPGIPEEYRQWEMRFIGPGTYRWRAASWPEGQYNDVVGVKCSAR
jgi:hypothetical protein